MLAPILDYSGNLSIGQPGCFCNIFSLCLDRDECEEGVHNCTDTNKCINTFGSYDCQCEVGYKYDKKLLKCVATTDSCKVGYQIINGTCEGKWRLTK